MSNTISTHQKIYEGTAIEILVPWEVTQEVETHEEGEDSSSD